MSAHFTESVFVNINCLGAPSLIVRLYCGVNETEWNRHPVAPGSHACVAPVYGASVRTKRENRVKLPKGTAVLQDSGAFSDGPGQRLSLTDALNRQIAHGQKYGYADQVTHVASYDLLIDEMWEDDCRHKGRWTEESAWQAVEETVAAARYLSKQRLPGRVLSAQGVTPKQYVACAQEVIPLLDDGDVFGLGGWCISGKIPTQMMPVFSETVTAVVPMLSGAGVKRAHIWGVIDSEFLGPLLWLCDHHGIELSTDSAGPQMRPARAGTWGYKGWINPNYQRAPVESRGLHRAIHVALTRCYLNHGLRQSQYYAAPKNVRQKHNQRSLF